MCKYDNNLLMVICISKIAWGETSVDDIQNNSYHAKSSSPVKLKSLIKMFHILALGIKKKNQNKQAPKKE